MDDVIRSSSASRVVDRIFNDCSRNTVYFFIQERRGGARGDAPNLGQRGAKHTFLGSSEQGESPYLDMFHPAGFPRKQTVGSRRLIDPTL